MTGLPAPPSPWTWRVYQSDAGAALPVRVSQYDVCPSLISDLCISISVIFITYLNLGSHSLWPFDIIIAREEEPRWLQYKDSYRWLPAGFTSSPAPDWRWLHASFLCKVRPRSVQAGDRIPEYLLQAGWLAEPLNIAIRSVRTMRGTTAQWGSRGGQVLIFSDLLVVQFVEKAWVFAMIYCFVKRFCYFKLIL